MQNLGTPPLAPPRVMSKTCLRHDGEGNLSARVARLRLASPASDSDPGSGRDDGWKMSKAGGSDTPAGQREHRPEAGGVVFEADAAALHARHGGHQAEA